MVWKLYAEKIRPSLDNSIGQFDEHPINQPRIEPHQFLGPGVPSEKVQDETLNFGWMSTDDLDRLLDAEGIRYIDVMGRYRVERAPTRRKFIGSHHEYRLATFVHKLLKPADSVIQVNVRGGGRYALMNQAERDRFLLGVQNLARNKIGGMLDQ